MQFRRHALTRIVAVTLGVALCAETIGWGHTGWDDPGCDPVPVFHSQSVERFTTGTATPAPDTHCLLCHLLRLLNTGLSAKPATVGLLSRVEPHWPNDAALHPTLVYHPGSGRGPPSSASPIPL
jgi:hypothetical protein